MRYWKVLDENGRSCHGGSFQWSLPTWDKRRGWIPGEWTPALSPRMCERGYHVCRDEHVVKWLHARIYACEVRGAIIEADDKVCAESVRLIAPTPWDETSARLFAIECAASCLDEYEKRHPGDLRVSDCIEVAMRLAMGEATEAERSAARSAAEAAAESAAWSAAESAAWSAAQSAAWSAAESAAWSAAQSAAWSAAESAARSAAEAAAQSAARSAAQSAARSAAESAAWSAAAERLLWWIGAA